MRARIEMPYQWPSGSRYCGATTLSSASDLIGWVMPARTASSMRPMSTVKSTSAGLLVPSVLIRCSRPELAEITLTLMPEVLGEGVEQRLDQAAFAIGVDVDVARLGKRRSAERDDRRAGKRETDDIPGPLHELLLSVRRP